MKTLILCALSISIGMVHLNAQRYLTPQFETSTITDIEYGQAENYLGFNQSLTLDFFEPANDVLSERPLVIYAHGGGFTDVNQTKDLIHIQAYCDSLAARGYAVASINYRLDESISNRAVINAMHDAKAAVRFFRRYASEYRIHPDKIFMAGESAGAVTALNVAFIDNEEEVSYPPTLPLSSDFTVEGSSGNDDYSSEVAAVLPFCGGTQTILNDLMFDPNAIENSNDPSICQVHGTADTFVPVANALEVAIRADEVGVPYLFFTLPDANHCPWFFPLENSWAYMDTLISYSVPFLYACVQEIPNNIEELNTSPISIFPNPTNEFIQVRNLTEKPTFYEIISTKGIVLKKGQTTGVIETHDLADGIYFLTIIQHGDLRKQLKFVKQ